MLTFDFLLGTATSVPPEVRSVPPPRLPPRLVLWVCLPRKLVKISQRPLATGYETPSPHDFFPPEIRNDNLEKHCSIAKQARQKTAPPSAHCGFKKAYICFFFHHEQKGLRVTVQLTIQNRQAAVSVVPTASSLVIRALKEPPRDRKKEKNIKHNKSVTLDEIIEIGRTMRHKSFSKSLEGTVKEVLGTAFSVGCQVDGKSPKAIQDAIAAGEIDSEFSFLWWLGFVPRFCSRNNSWSKARLELDTTTEMHTV